MEPIGKDGAPSGGERIPLIDNGAFYWANGERISLKERKEQIAIIVEEDNPQRTLNRLTADGGVLEGFEVVERFGENKYILEQPSGVERNFAQLQRQVEAQAGVTNATPVYQTELSDSFLIADNEVIVSLKSGVSAEEFFGGDSRIAEFRPLMGTPDQYVVTVNNANQVIDIANELQAESETQWASPNFYQDIQKYFTPNDPLYGNQWHLHNTGQFGGVQNADVNAPEAWNINQGGSSDVVVSVIDDGMQLDHPDLNYWQNPGEIANNGIDDDGNGWVDDTRGWDFTSGGIGDNNPGPSTIDDAHATSVAGVAAANGNNNLGVAGIAYKSRVMPVRIFEGQFATTDANIASAVYYAAGRTANGTGTWQASQILNNSWGGGSPSTAITNAFTWASTNGRNGRGAISLIAAGNDFGSSVSYPANLSDDISGVIAVGASDNQNNRAFYSNVGPELDVVAPSSGGTADIVTTDRTGSDGYVSGDYTIPSDGFGGTSSATPLTAGIAALLLAQNSNLTAVQVRGLLRNTTDFIGSGYNNNGFSNQFGYGKVNAQTALAGVGIREIQVLDRSGNIADNTGQVDFSAGVGGEVIKTLRVRNQGTENLTLGSINISGGGFTLVNGFSDTNLSVGESATFSVKFTPTSIGNFTGNISFTNNDTDEGTFNFSLSGVGTNSQSFSNTNPITINDGTNATPYPSTINVSGVGGTVESVKVTLNEISHTWSSDVDVLLVSPLGQKSLLMSDVGGGSIINGVTLTFDADAASGIGDSQIVSGTYQPRNIGEDDVFSSPAPGGPYGTDLSVFEGSTANGNWSLYVVDDLGGDVGQIAGGWELEFETTGGPVLPVVSLAVTPSQVTEDGASNLTYTFTRTGSLTSPLAVNFNVGGTASFSTDYTQTGAASFNGTTGTINFAAGASSASIIVDPQVDATIESDETVQLTVASGSGYAIGTGTATGTIADDDTPPSSTVGAFDSGWYDETGEHDSTNTNYLVGNSSFDSLRYRNWFAFDLPNTSLPIVGAELRINTYDIFTSDASETYELRAVSTPISQLTAGGLGLTSIYNDLGDGTVYGSRNFTPSESNSSVSIPLNTSLVNALNAANGGEFALGGQITTLDGNSSTDEYAYGFSGFDPNTDIQLLLTYGTANLPSLTVRDVTVVEGNTPTAVFTVRLSAPSSTPVTVNYTTNNGTGTAGADYTAATGTVTFAAGQINQTVAVPILDDNLNEVNETFTLDLSGATGATINDGQGRGTISDTLSASVTTTLPAGVENLQLTGSANINGTGNNNGNIITGNAGNNTLSGLNGNDTLNGGAGVDTLVGGTGNDTYRIDSTTDVITETITSASEIDTVESTVTHSLGSNLENLTLTGTAAISGTGNTRSNNIVGNNAANTLDGGTANDSLSGNNGNDSLVGGTGNDSLVGGAGNDTLNGGTGVDTLNGGAGRDTYLVDNAGDVVTETSTATSEIDSVQSSINYSLVSNVENLTLTGTAINGTGNALRNVIIGNNSNNVLNGGAGNDTLTGGVGNDQFRFSTGLPFAAADVGVDRIEDFTSLDKIVLSKATFTAINSATGNGFSISGEFAQVATDAAAGISSADIVYNTTNGKLFYNQNGTAAGFGSGAQFALIAGSPIPSITAANFTIVA